MDFYADQHYTGWRGKMTREGTAMTEQEKTTAPTTNTAAKPPVANMDETDWTAMLMEMRILSA